MQFFLICNLAQWFFLLIFNFHNHFNEISIINLEKNKFFIKNYGKLF